MDERVERGTRAMLALRERRIAAGERPIGWKVGFGSPSAFERLGTDRPLVGFMTDAGRLDDAAVVAIGDWRNPHLELEVAVHLGEGGSIAGTSAAIELVDTHPVSTDPEEILAGDIYHRHVILGPVDRSRLDGTGVTGALLRDGEEIATAADPAAATGEITGVVAAALRHLRVFGVDINAGDVIITGSVFAPVPVGPGHYEGELPPLGTLSVDLTR
jgi:2-keto-4-pentenoate hydratase